MAFPFPNAVWTERESDIPGTLINEGDWEACVATSYAMGLLHGGVKMAAPYTQAERERLEKVKDSPQDLNTTDGMSLTVYGKVLRKFSTGSIAAAVTRVGVGMVIVGTGSPGRQWQAGFAGQHCVFYVPTSSASGYLADPLAPNLQPFELIASSKIVAWAKAPGPNDAREVRLNEFAPLPPPVTYTQAQLNAAVQEAVNGERAKWLTWNEKHP